MRWIFPIMLNITGNMQLRNLILSTYENWDKLAWTVLGQAQLKLDGTLFYLIQKDVTDLTQPWPKKGFSPFAIWSKYVDNDMSLKYVFHERMFLGLKNTVFWLKKWFLTINPYYFKWLREFIEKTFG